MKPKSSDTTVVDWLKLRCDLLVSSSIYIFSLSLSIYFNYKMKYKLK